MGKLILKFNSDVLDEFELRQGDMSIGRRPGSDILIDNLAVSGNHASIFTIGDDSFIQDLDSTNGTYINNKKITKHHLKNGDVIVIGKHSLVYVGAEAVQTDEFAKTMVISPSAKSGLKPKADPEEQRPGALFILSGANSGKRIDLHKGTTNIGKAGKPAGAISRVIHMPMRGAPYPPAIPIGIQRGSRPALPFLGPIDLAGGTGTRDIQRVLEEMEPAGRDR